MLAPHDDPIKRPTYFEELQLPLLGSPKLDGIRCAVKEDDIVEFGSDLEVASIEAGEYVCKSREFINLPSRQVQSLFTPFHNLDGEIIVGNETDHGVYNRTQSHVMSVDKPATDISFRVFDYAGSDASGIEFDHRLEIARSIVDNVSLRTHAKVSIIEHVWLDSVEDILEYEATQLLLGYEGIMLKSPFGTYKNGRGTWLEGLIYKLKRFRDDEAIIVGFYEQNINTNVDIRDNLGYAKRSSSKEGLVPANTMGGIYAEFLGQVLDIAPGVMKHDERKIVWDNQEKYIVSSTHRHCYWQLFNLLSGHRLRASV